MDIGFFKNFPDSKMGTRLTYCAGYPYRTRGRMTQGHIGREGGGHEGVGNEGVTFLKGWTEPS